MKNWSSTGERRFRSFPPDGLSMTDSWTGFTLSPLLLPSKAVRCGASVNWKLVPRTVALGGGAGRFEIWGFEVGFGPFSRRKKLHKHYAEKGDKWVLISSVSIQMGLISSVFHPSSWFSFSKFCSSTLTGVQWPRSRVHSRLGHPASAKFLSASKPARTVHRVSWSLWSRWVWHQLGPLGPQPQPELRSKR